MDEFAQKRPNVGPREKMDVIEKDGDLKTANGSDSVSLESAHYAFGKLPYFLQISEIREIIYCADGLCAKRTYMIWHNMLYTAGWAGAIVGAYRRLLAIDEMGGIDHYFRALVFGASSKNKQPVEEAAENALANARLMVELQPRFISVGFSNGEPSQKRPKPNPKNPISPPHGKVKTTTQTVHNQPRTGRSSFSRARI